MRLYLVRTVNGDIVRKVRAKSPFLAERRFSYLTGLYTSLIVKDITNNQLNPIEQCNQLKLF